MRGWLTMSIAAGLALLAVSPVAAQDRRDDYDDSRDDERLALAVGVGLVEPSGDVETYLMAALRIQVGGRDSGSRGGSGDEGIRGYIEPEVGYWEASGDNLEGSDLLLGVNLIGVVPLGAVDSFFGVGAGLHFLDAQLLDNDPTADGSETKVGANAQFGIDLRMTRSWSAFGAGRFDLVQGAADNVQSKVYLGVRGRF